VSPPSGTQSGIANGSRPELGGAKNGITRLRSRARAYWPGDPVGIRRSQRNALRRSPSRLLADVGDVGVEGDRRQPAVCSYFGASRREIAVLPAAFLENSLGCSVWPVPRTRHFRSSADALGVGLIPGVTLPKVPGQLHRPPYIRIRTSQGQIGHEGRYGSALMTAGGDLPRTEAFSESEGRRVQKAALGGRLEFGS